ncbi:MAG TPA: radical SAM protein [Terriglobales bacterium]|nr:radical SAM protein [Terriglobales bacterium]
MKKSEVVQAWGRILRGIRPTLSIEITRECPLHCPGCYAYEDMHLGTGVNLRRLADKKGDELIAGVLGVVDEYRPLHVSLVGGEPLVRYRELEVIVPELRRRGVHVQVVTSAVRPLPESWKAFRDKFTVAVSIDGLQPEHDLRRRPATYERILKHIAGHRVIIHCTVTGQMVKRAGYLNDFLAFWTPRPEIGKVWFSFFTPQRGAMSPEVLTPEERAQTIELLLKLREAYPKLDMRASVIREFARPPESPEECIFAKTTHTISADLKTRVTPCQFGGDPDCSQCGCMASMGLAAVGNYKLIGGLTAGHVFRASFAVGDKVKSLTQRARRTHKGPAGARVSALKILPASVNGEDGR